MLSAGLVAFSCSSNWPHPRQVHETGVPPSFDCAMRKLAYDFGQKTLPRKGKFESLFYALDLNNPCNGENFTMTEPTASSHDFVPESAPAADAIYVSPTGDDSAAGDSAHPLKTVQAAMNKAASAKSTSVLLETGTYFLTAAVQVGAQHSGISVAAAPAASPVISGGKKLTTSWKPYKTTGANIYVADISGQVDDVWGLQIVDSKGESARATRARYPNLPGGLETSCGYGCMVSSGSAAWTKPDMNKYGKVDFYTDEVPEHHRNDTPSNWFQNYMIGVKGLCSVYDPPVSYWCSEHPSGGGAFAFRTPSGMTPKKDALPNAPYKDVSTAILNVWRPARWANWMFEVEEGAAGEYKFTKGGNQGARGNDKGGDFFIENVMEELDYPGEFFYDKKSSQLYLYYNATNNATVPPPAELSFVATQIPVLLNVSGTQAEPVKDVTFSGIQFTQTRYTYMEPHGVPSAGDWALDRISAVFLQGTEGVELSDCHFLRLDGNAVLVSGYNRNATVKDSDFEFIGGNAVAAWGYTNETENTGFPYYTPNSNYPAGGVDGTDGNHPRYTTVTGNLAREVGHYEKQSSFFVQVFGAKTAESVILGNVFFNGPRAGINANDGFGGGDEIGHNLVFSTCRESGDHGPFNSWDRQPFLTTIRTGKPDMIMQWREIHHNFFIDNYSPQENVDNDDGSCFYHTHDNFLVYGGQGMKNDFGGHDNHHYNNIYAYAGRAMGVTNTLEGHEDYFYGNKAVLTGSNIGGVQCKAPATVVHDNEYYTPDGKISECGKSLDDLQKLGQDKNSTVAKTPADDTIIGWAKNTLGM